MRKQIQRITAVLIIQSITAQGLGPQLVPCHHIPARNLTWDCVVKDSLQADQQSMVRTLGRVYLLPLHLGFGHAGCLGQCYQRLKKNKTISMNRLAHFCHCSEESIPESLRSQREDERHWNRAALAKASPDQPAHNSVN